jgi:hypothetical protein
MFKSKHLSMSYPPPGHMPADPLSLPYRRRQTRTSPPMLTLRHHHPPRRQTSVTQSQCALLGNGSIRTPVLLTISILCLQRVLRNCLLRARNVSLRYTMLGKIWR